MYVSWPFILARRPLSTVLIAVPYPSFLSFSAASHFFSPKDLEDFEKESRKMPNQKAVALTGQK